MPASSLARLGFRGTLIAPEHDDYDRVRTAWKGVVRRPALIACCRDVSDVRRVIEYARTARASLAVMGTGHDVAARSIPDDALVLCTSAMRAIEVDAPRQLITVQPGVRWGDLCDAVEPYGLATTGASVATVGVAGFVLHGGFGWLMRRCGAGCDNIAALDLITADGEMRTVTADADPDLFWAMRGAGSNFGVVTSLTLHLHTIPRVLAGVLVYPAERAREVLEVYKMLTIDAPDTLTTHFYYMGGEGGTHAAGIGICFSGDTRDADRVLAPLDCLGIPWRTSVREVSVAGLQAVHDSSTPVGGRYHLRSHYLSALDDEFMAVMLEHCKRITAPLTKVFIEHLGGAMARVPAEATAFRGRAARYSFLAVAGFRQSEAASPHIRWVRDLDDAVRPFAMEGAYVNYLDDDEDHRIPAAYGPGYARLLSLKRRYDSDNLFRANRNLDAKDAP